MSRSRSGTETLKVLPCKLVLLGDSAVGKSSLVLRFVHGKFSDFHNVTIGAAFLTQTVQTDAETAVKYEIWDTAGQERFQSLAPMYYRGAGAAIVAYSITDPDTFSKAQAWVHELQEQKNPNMVICLAGNKVDLQDKHRAVDQEVVQRYANENGLLFFETSAKTAQNVSEMFLEIAKRLKPKAAPLKPVSEPVKIDEAMLTGTAPSSGCKC